VIRSFDQAAAEDLFNGRDTKSARRFARDLWSPIRRKLASLDAADSLADLAAVPGYRLEALKGDQKGRYSIRVNDQYRITFRFEEGHASAVRCEDYH
jgi:proteic killer suppression protein